MTITDKDCFVRCPTCGQRYSEYEWQELSFISGGPITRLLEGETVPTMIGKATFRRCEYCNGQICSKTIFGSGFGTHEIVSGDSVAIDYEPVTERNPVPSILPKASLEEGDLAVQQGLDEYEANPVVAIMGALKSLSVADGTDEEG